jgi:hypothetical protein
MISLYYTKGTLPVSVILLLTLALATRRLSDKA